MATDAPRRVVVEIGAVRAKLRRLLVWVVVLVGPLLSVQAAVHALVELCAAATNAEALMDRHVGGIVTRPPSDDIPDVLKIRIVPLLEAQPMHAAQPGN